MMLIKSPSGRPFIRMLRYDRGTCRFFAFSFVDFTQWAANTAFSGKHVGTEPVG